MTAPEPCTTESRRRRHYSTDLHPGRHAPRRPGRSGRTLCGLGGRDEERANAPYRVFNEETYVYDLVPRTKQVRVADLPACRLCEKAAAKRAGREKG